MDNVFRYIEFNKGIDIEEFYFYIVKVGFFGVDFFVGFDVFEGVVYKIVLVFMIIWER